MLTNISSNADEEGSHNKPNIIRGPALYVPAIDEYIHGLYHAHELVSPC